MTNPTKEAFGHELHQALINLYNPTELRKNPLLTIFNVADSHDPLTAIQRILRKSIQSLKPSDKVPLHADAWRVFQVLEYRYLEQLSQKEVSVDLNLSIRQLRRNEKKAIEILADHLISNHQLTIADAAHLDTSQENKPPISSHSTPGHENELAWLKESLPSEFADISNIIETAVETITPLAESNQSKIVREFPEILPLVIGQTSVLRQTILGLLTIAIHQAPGGVVLLTADIQQEEIHLHLHSKVEDKNFTPPSLDDQEVVENLPMVHQLTKIFNGKLDVQSTPTQDQSFKAVLTLPAVEQVKVLVIDDNTDTLALFERYLEDTRYHFTSISDPQQAISLANEIRPQIIIMDVMLPEIDGWELLGRFRTHPKTRNIPVIACTILPQEQLALTLGAAGFLRKPVSRETLISVLDQQIDFSKGLN